MPFNIVVVGWHTHNKMFDEIGADLASDAVDRVALLATLGGEHARARHRILARAERRLGPRDVTGDQRECERTSRHRESDHCQPFFVATRITDRHTLSDGRRCYSKAFPTTRITATSAAS